jgi:NAD-dependent deacetylase
MPPIPTRPAGSADAVLQAQIAPSHFARDVDVLILSEIDEVHSALRDLVEHSRKAVAFTGAGISTECGVPDFRSKNSPWIRLEPIAFERFMSDVLMREEAWRRKFAMDDLYAKAQPGRGHIALVNLVAAGKLKAIITQNIDNLHQASGVPDDRIIELHGNGSYATCLACGHRHELDDIRLDFEASGAAPQCVCCGGIVKSATISFGQAMPALAMRRAREHGLDCDLFLAIGSSLVVYPAADFPLLASHHGARLVIINGEETPLDEAADLVLRGDIGDILQPFAN